MQSLAFSIASRGISSNCTRAVWSASCSVMPFVIFPFLVDALATRILERRSRNQKPKPGIYLRAARAPEPFIKHLSLSASSALLWCVSEVCACRATRAHCGDCAILCALRLCKLGRMGSRQAAEYRALHQTRSTGVIVEKRSACDFSRGKESADHIAAVVFDLAFFRNADAAECKGDTTRHGKGVKRRCVQALCPVRLHRRDAVSVFAVVFRWIEGRVIYGGIEFIHRADDVLPVQSRQLFCQCFDVVGAGVESAVVLRAQQWTRFAVENLVGGAPRQAQDLATAFAIGVAEKVLAFVDESFAVDIDHNPIRVGVAMLVGTLHIGSFRVHQNGMAAAPMTHGLGAESQ